MNFFEAAKQHRSWLADRQSVVARNIANANTPGYKAMSAGSFDALLGAPRSSQVVTHQNHMTSLNAPGSQSTIVPEGGANANHSENTVDIIQELTASGEIKSAYAFNSAATKSFNRMLMAVVRI